MLNLDGNFWTGVASGLAVGIGTYLFGSSGILVAGGGE